MYRGGQCVYLANHRSYADFFIDLYITECRAAVLARRMVALGFPLLVSSVAVLRGILLFHRRKLGSDKEVRRGPDVWQRGPAIWQPRQQ